MQDIARNIIRGYFGESKEPHAVGPHPMIADRVDIKEESDARVASWSLRQEFLDRTRNHARS